MPNTWANIFWLSGPRSVREALQVVLERLMRLGWPCRAVSAGARFKAPSSFMVLNSPAISAGDHFPYSLATGTNR